MAGRLEGRVAIVTGAGRGIGRGEALALASEGAAVVINDLGGSTGGEGADTTPAEDVASEITKAGGRAVVNTADVSDFNAAGAMVQQALDEFGQLDILVNNAGILRDRMVFNMTEEEWDIVIAVHLKGTFNMCKHATVLMRQQRSGRIINTSSESGFGNPGQANYAAAKEGITGLTRAVAMAMARYGVTCNSIRPRAATRLTLSPEMEQAAASAAARGESRGGGGDGGGLGAMNPDVVGRFIAYLASDEAKNVTMGDFLVFGNQITSYTLPQPQGSIQSTGDEWTIDDIFDQFPKELGKFFDESLIVRAEKAAAEQTRSS
ncbi:MAG: SDR family NAD(P)-dependent oxidoreductase [Dehalococcoidia bacterium]